MFAVSFVVVIALGITFCRFAMGGLFTTNVDAENQTLINHKCVCGALNRHFCQTRVIGCPSFVSPIVCEICIALIPCKLAFLL